MGWEYTKADRALCEVDSFRFRIKRWYDRDMATAAGPSAAWGAGQITGCSTRASADTRGRFRQPGVGSGVNDQFVDIEFQFPPKVLTDGRKGNWFEGELTGGKEPVAVFKTSGPRQLSLSWTYIVDSFKADSTSWNIERITRNIRTLRGYFANARARGDGSAGARDGLVVEFWAWCIGGSTPISARIVGIDVKYGETMVFPPASNTESGGTSAFPLRTDITIDFRLWTKLLYAKNAEGMVDAAPNADGTPGTPTRSEFGLLDLDRLTDFEPPDWF